MEPQKAREAVRIPWQWCLPESVRGEACACKNSREGGVHTSVVLASTVLLACQKRGDCTLGQLTSPRSESVFFASFLCRFGQRNDVPPRTVAKSDKEKSQLKQTTNAESSNPALTPTANSGTWQPGINPDHHPQTHRPRPPVRTSTVRALKPHPPHPAAARRALSSHSRTRQTRSKSASVPG